MTGEVHVDDVGTVFQVTIKDEDEVVVDVSNALTKTIYFRKPNGTLLTKTASFVTDGTDGQIKYTTESGDIDAAGNWSLQSFVDFGTTEFYSDIHKFTVYNNLGC